MADSKTAAKHARGKPTILIVDDSPTIRKLVSMTLESRGYTVVVACDGVDGLAKMQEGRPDLILSDITMPKLDGYQFCKVIKNNKETKNIPVILLSGNDGLFDKVRGRMAGSANYITKPFEPNNLVKEIEKFVKASRPVKAAPAPAARQPATAQGQPPAQKKTGRPQPAPADPAAAKQLTQKLSGIYIPSGAAGGTAARAEGTATAAPPPAAQGRGEAPPRTEPTAAAAKRPTAKRNDEPEIKIIYNDAQTAASSPEEKQPPKEHSAPTQSAPAAQRPQAPARQPQQEQPAAGRPQPTAAPAAKSPAPRPAAPQPAGAGGQLLKATCSGCGTVYANIKPAHVGKYARCKKCGTRFMITV